MNIKRNWLAGLWLCVAVLLFAGVAPASTFDITSFGAVGDSVTDDGPAMQSAVDAAAVDGGIVHVPAGTYRVATGVTVPSGVTLRGIGWRGSSSASTRKGSWILIDHTDFVPITLSGDGVGIERLAFVHNHPHIEAPFWLPGGFPYTIEIVGEAADRVRLRDLLLLNPTRGIRQKHSGEAGGASGLYIDGIYGQPLEHGIHLSRLAGTAFIQNVKFDTRWSTDPDVLAHMENHLRAIWIDASERLSLQNVRVTHAYTGLILSGNSFGVAERVRISNFDCTPCRSGLEVLGTGVSVKVANLSYKGHTPAPWPWFITQPLPGHGIAVFGTEAELLLEGVKLSTPDAAGIYVLGSDSVVTVDGLRIEDWDEAGQGRYALEVSQSSSQILVGFNHVLDGPMGQTVNDPTRVLFDL